MSKEILFENDSYEVRIFTHTDPTYNEELEVYGVYSKQTGVREAESRNLPGAMEWAVGLPSRMEQLELSLAAPEADVLSEAVAGKAANLH
jgi:hypothetical protein